MNTLSPGEPDTHNIDIHGKLIHLGAIDMSRLTLAKRYAMITLSGPWASDDYGRFTTTGGAFPRLPALTAREAKAAIRDLIKDGLICTWIIGDTTCWEVAGAYAFKPGLKQAMWERKKLAIQKRKEWAKRRERKKAADAGMPFAFEDDGGGTADDGGLVYKIRTKRGNLVPTRAGLWYRSTVPVPKGKSRQRMLVEQPDAPPDTLNLRLLPSFNPSEDLSALAAVLRHYLLMDCDDYGRVRLDIPRLCQQLGSAITKRISRAQVEAEIDAMIDSGHLMAVEKKNGRFAFVRDSAQHMREKKRYDRQLQRLHDDWEFTYDSEDYLAFFKACEKHSVSRTKLQVAQYNLRGDVHVVDEFVDVAAGRFVEEYQELMKTEPWMHLTLEQFCIGDDTHSAGFGNRAYPGGPYILPVELRFWHAIQCNAPAQLLDKLYRQYQEGFDGSSPDLGRNRNIHKIFTYLLKMIPSEFIERKLREELPSAPPPPPPGPVAGEHTYLPVPLDYISWDGSRYCAPGFNI
ncbi:MAG: hypothetical protein MUF86_08965 [Akkermansiaceae bacterium]|jgi:hypothetical protein|nr:hypothetical protein [Akkermansiaceae bacterium]